MEISIKDIQDKFKTLSPALQLAIMDAQIDNRVMEIGAKNSLNAEQMGELSLDVHLVVLGFIQVTQLKDLIKNSLGVNDEKAETLIGDINEKVMRKIREAMMSGGAPKEPEAEQKAPEAKSPSNNGAPLVKTLKDDMQTFKGGSVSSIIPPIEKVGEEKMLRDEWHLGQKDTPSHGIVGDKMSGAFQMPQAKTEYTMKNISKPENATGAVSPSQTSPKPKFDPYREPIE